MASFERPLRILLTAFGSRGDVVPRVALGQECRRRSHNVTIGCAERTRPIVESHGLQSVALGDYPPADVMARAYTQMAHEPDVGRRGEWMLGELLVPMLPGLWQRVEAMRGAFDLVVLNDLLATFVFAPFVDARQFAVALTSQPVGGLAGALGGSPCTKLVGSSPLLLPPDHGLDPSYQITDFWLPEPATAFTPDSVLAGFLSPGHGPVVAVVLGSAWGTDPLVSRQALAEAAGRAGVRLVLQDHSPPPGASVVSDDSEVLSIGEVSYAWLFERVDAVLHHGGAGTVAEALRAGCPSITVPHYGDHLYWAKRLEAVGASAGTLLPRELAEGPLAEHLDRAVGDDDLRRRVETLGSRLDVAGGVGRACDRIEALARQAVSGFERR
jgi:UDP:flavonoid glycosyltransferase YjiC (YdhE family)